MAVVQHVPVINHPATCGLNLLPQKRAAEDGVIAKDEGPFFLQLLRNCLTARNNKQHMLQDDHRLASRCTRWQQLIEPPLDLGQPAARLLGIAEPLVGKGQPAPVELLPLFICITRVEGTQ
jgi:hypothetical protein